MHEFSIAEGLVATVKEQLQPGVTLVSVKVTIGPLSGISADSLIFCFTELAAQAGLGEARLEVVCNPARLKCSACARVYEAQSFFITCPQCGSLQRTVLSGSEFVLESMEIEEKT